MQIHSDACDEECHLNFQADVKRVIDEEFGTDAPIMLQMKKPLLLRSSASKGTGGDKNATSV